MSPLTYLTVLENFDFEGNIFLKEKKIIVRNYQNFKIRDSSFVGILILRHFILVNWS